MLLGKRTRQPIKRTTSMTGITVDVSNVEDDDDVVDQQPIISDSPHHNHGFPDGNFCYDQRFLAMVSPRNPAYIGSSAFTKHLVDTTKTASFLRSCWLCNRRLAPARDIYMYRGDTAFCSLGCREKQMKQDERKEKLNINNAIASASKKEDRHVHASSTTTAAVVATTSKASKTEPVVAA